MSPAGAPPTRRSSFRCAPATSPSASALISRTARWRRIPAPASKPSHSTATASASPCRGLNFSWVREDTSYQWYQDNGSWKYQSTTRDRLITAGQMSIGTGAAAKMAQALPWGSYRLTITDPKSGAASSYRFYSGWAASSSGDRPDRIPVAADKPNYRVGDTARVSIKPTSSGKALVVVAGDRVFSSQLIDAPAGGTEVNVPVSAEWGAGAYVLVTDYRPLNEATGREPVRSIGLVWLGVDNSPRTLTALIGGPSKITPAPDAHRSCNDQGSCVRRGCLSDTGGGGRRHPAAHRLQIARSGRLLLRQAAPRCRHARRLRPPDQGREGPHRLDARGRATASAAVRSASFRSRRSRCSPAW